ncbi:uncharacterized protein TNCV_2236961 [Trichonephila clavipes]|nr:uncharacterized protein TNCV_2236961 [Trichonephila clavipes]
MEHVILSRGHVTITALELEPLSKPTRYANERDLRLDRFTVQLASPHSWSPVVPGLFKIIKPARGSDFNFIKYVIIFKNLKSHGIPSSPRAAAVAKFRLLTGHDCLCAHLFRFNLVTSPIYVLCDTGQDMTAAHLDGCSALNDLICIVKRYWRARCLMT